MNKLPVCQTEQINTAKNHLEWLLIKEYLLIDLKNSYSRHTEKMWGKNFLDLVILRISAYWA